MSLRDRHVKLLQRCHAPDHTTLAQKRTLQPQAIQIQLTQPCQVIPRAHQQFNRAARGRPTPSTLSRPSCCAQQVQHSKRLRHMQPHRVQWQQRQRLAGSLVILGYLECWQVHLHAAGTGARWCWATEPAIWLGVAGMPPVAPASCRAQHRLPAASSSLPMCPNSTRCSIVEPSHTYLAAATGCRLHSSQPCCTHHHSNSRTEIARVCS